MGWDGTEGAGRDGDTRRLIKYIIVSKGLFLDSTFIRRALGLLLTLKASTMVCSLFVRGMYVDVGHFKSCRFGL